MTKHQAKHTHTVRSVVDNSSYKMGAQFQDLTRQNGVDFVQGENFGRFHQRVQFPICHAISRCAYSIYIHTVGVAPGIYEPRYLTSSALYVVRTLTPTAKLEKKQILSAIHRSAGSYLPVLLPRTALWRTTTATTLYPVISYHMV